MALRAMDGFDHYNSILQKWTLANTGVTFSSSGTRFGVGQCIQPGNNSISKGFDNQATWIVGIAVYLSAIPTTTAIIALQDDGTTQVDLRITNFGAITVTRNGASLGVTANGIISAAVWYYLELKATINNTTGSFEVRLNGVNVLSATGQNTRATANNYANVLQLSSVTQYFFDDLYVCDTSGSAPQNDFLGDVRVQGILPSGAGNSAQWTPSAGSNYQCVDDATPNSDTDYVSSATVNQVDTYAFSNVTPTAGTVYGVAVHLFARKDDAGVRSIAPVVRSGGTDYVGTTQPLAASYQYLTQGYPTNPATSAAWTISEVNAAEFGVKLTA